MVPRAILSDFRDNFGNFSACFAVETHQDADHAAFDRFGNPLEESKGGSDQWQGKIAVSREDPIALSAFHQELNAYADEHGYGEEIEQPGAARQEQEEEDEEMDERERRR